MQFKSGDDIKKALSWSDILEIDCSDLTLLLDDEGLNSLLYNEPFSKICFTCSVVSGFLQNGKVVYLDLDTLFTAYVRNGIFYADSGHLEIFLPSENEFERMLSDICSLLNPDVKLVVVDSLNSFYHLYDRMKIGSLNRLLSSYVSLLLNHTKRLGCKLLVTSMIRHKKASEWILAPSSKRLIEAKSSVILSAELVKGSLFINLLKHQPLKMDSKKLVIAKQYLPIKA